MRPEDAHLSLRVRVVVDRRTPHLTGEIGTIERTYTSSSGRMALHVRLEDGRWQLLWPQEVRPLAKENSPVESSENL